MEEQNHTPLSTREQLSLVLVAIIVAGMAANYSTVSPTPTHIYIAQGIAKDILKIVLKR